MAIALQDKVNLLTETKYSIGEVARILGSVEKPLSTRTVTRYILEGKFKAMRHSRCKQFVLKSELEKYLKSIYYDQPTFF